MPDTPSSADRDGLAKRISKASRAPYIAGIPELALFPDEESRNQALRDFDRSMTPRSVADLLRFLAAVVIFTAIPAGFSFALMKFVVPPMGPWTFRIGLALTLIGYTVIVAFAIRRNVPKEMRKRLLKIGIPVCMSCGYDLRGLAGDTTRCPECGTGLNAATRTALMSPRG